MLRQHTKKFWMAARSFFGWILSPTWMSAKSAKLKLRGGARSRLIRFRNQRYFKISLVLAATAQFVSFVDNEIVQQRCLMPIRVVVAAYLVSRCNEVFYAFYRDAIEKLLPRHGPRSNLSWARRLRLALNSYAELVIDFALLFFLLPPASFAPQARSFGDHLFYSASTITTSGGGGIAPNGIGARLLTDYEVFCGLILIVVCFAVYVGRALAEKERRVQDEPTPQPTLIRASKMQRINVVTADSDHVSKY